MDIAGHAIHPGSQAPSNDIRVLVKINVHYVKVCVCALSRSVMSDSLQPHGL